MSLQKNQGLKQWEGIYSKGAYFQEIMYPLCSLMWHKLWRCVTRSYIHTLYLADTLAYQLKFESFQVILIKFIVSQAIFFHPTMHEPAIQNVFSNLCTINSCSFKEGSICFCLQVQTVGLVPQARPFLFLRSRCSHMHISQMIHANHAD